jgi:hypothetical protein
MTDSMTLDLKARLILTCFGNHEMTYLAALSALHDLWEEAYEWGQSDNKHKEQELRIIDG